MTFDERVDEIVEFIEENAKGQENEALKSLVTEAHMIGSPGARRAVMHIAKKLRQRGRISELVETAAILWVNVR